MPTEVNGAAREPASPGALAPLESLDALRDVRAFGGKAARLGELSRAGFPVPSGMAIPVSTVEAACAEGGDEVMATLVREVIATLGEGPMAVRSSGVAEDLATASFAGQYETVLKVRGHEAIAEAIQRCRASAERQHVAAYSNNHVAEVETAIPAVRGMAVLIQQMVAADAAGVAFTADPVTGDRGVTLVSAVRGLGERLVSGEASPDEWVVRDGVASARALPEEAISQAQVLEVATLARQVEGHFGAPQDIEWAIAGRELVLLQARPITTLRDAGHAEAVGNPPPELETEVPPGFWVREVTHFPMPLMPVTRAHMLPLFRDSCSEMFAELGLLLEGLELREIGGWVYMREVPLGGKDGAAPPALVMKVASWFPPLRGRILACVRAMRERIPWEWLEQWEQEWRPSIIAENASIRGVDLPALSDEALVAHLERVRAHMHHAGWVHFRLSAPNGFGVGELALACRELLGWDGRQLLRLVSGHSTMSSAPGRSLAEVAALVAVRPAVLAMLQRSPLPSLEEVRSADRDVDAALQGYLDEFGCRALRYEVGEPSLEEVPELVVQLLADQLASGYDPAARAAELEAAALGAETEARSLLAGRPADLAVFEAALAVGRHAYGVREENEFYTVSVPLALTRYALLEAGRRLTERGQIAERDDVMWLDLTSVKSALLDGASRQGEVERALAVRDWALAHPGPESYGTPPPPPPSLSVFPKEVQRAHEILAWEMEHNFSPPVTDHDAERLRGIGASGGTYTGTARIVMDESEFHRIRPGDVLVCPITSPVWSLVFPSIGALVTESGGVLSHPAIIAREHAIPAVVAVGGATQLVRDGATVTVDGTTGEVRLIH